MIVVRDDTTRERRERVGEGTEVALGSGASAKNTKQSCANLDSVFEDVPVLIKGTPKRYKNTCDTFYAIVSRSSR